MDKKEKTIKILIVEDSLTQAEGLKHILEEQGHQVIHAMNGKDAFAILKDQEPDLIISDIVMPEMDGYELCRRLTMDDRWRDIPVVLVTYLSDPRDVIRGLEAGASHYIRKPYEAKYLLSLIKRIIMNQALHTGEESGEGVRIFFRGEYYNIAADRMRILNLLLTTFETAVEQNEELIRARDDLSNINEELETRVQERTTALIQEVAERKHAEVELKNKNSEIKIILQQLWQAAKLATMGELASSIAHELNNPLATASLRIESLTAQTPESDPRRRELEIVGQEIERMGNLVTNLLQFSRRSQQQISTVDVCEEMEKTFELIEYHLRKNNVKVIREFATDVPCIHADRQQLRQLFLNLFTNASDAMPKGGTLTIRVHTKGSGVRGQESGVAQTPARSLSGPEADPRSPIPDFVVIEIADTGVGIPPEILPKVMEAFFTTKLEGKGTGLGLAICQRIAQEHKGTFDIVSEGIPGKGTRVCIALPFSNVSNAKSFKDE
ncbi:MAG TPA: response regulator [Syntrophales bacterium]|nr:response regulator [Syntrophales bacterium]